MSSIKIQKIGVTKLKTDAIVNAANEQLAHGSGVCGAIFREAGAQEMAAACNVIGGCKTGNAVITPGFNLPAKYVVHAVGPRWHGGDNNEPKLLYSAYKQSLIVAKDNGCHSIGFPLISAGIFGYPVDKAWRKALQACNDFIENNPDYDIDIIFAVLDDKIMADGEDMMKELGIGENDDQPEEFVDPFDGPSEEEFIESVAMKCIGEMSKEDRQVFLDNPDPTDHHFGYGMYIRNEYIHDKKLPLSLRFVQADDLSAKILERIIVLLKIMEAGREALGIDPNLSDEEMTEQIMKKILNKEE